MYLVAVGLNHKTAAVTLRETVSLDADECVALLERLRLDGVRECAILSTCNRTEVYLVADAPAQAWDEALSVFQRLAPLESRRAVLQSLYRLAGADAARHLFEVAGGCDSLVIGEAQVLGQVREALNLAHRAKSAGPIISQLFNQAIRTGRRVRTETPIGEGAASLSHAAVELAKEIFSDLDQTTVLLVGAGKMAELAALNLSTHGAPRVLVANRTEANARQLADAIAAQAVPLDDVERLLADVDVVIASTGARGHVVTADAVSRALQRRSGRPLFLIDIAVPRDVDPEVQRLKGAFLYNVDDLQSVVDKNLAERRRYLPQALSLIDEETRRFRNWMDERKAAPLVAALRGKVLETAEREVERALLKLEGLTEREKEQVRALARAITGKILHEPTVKIKSSVAAGRHEEVFSVVSELFDLEATADAPDPERGQVIHLVRAEESAL